MLTRENVLNRQPKFEVVAAPEIDPDATLNVKLLSAAEFMKLSNDGKSSPDLAYAHWIAATVCDTNGVPLFKPEDLSAVGNLPFPLVNRLIDAAYRINGVGDQAEKK